MDLAFSMIIASFVCLVSAGWFFVYKDNFKVTVALISGWAILLVCGLVAILFDNKPASGDFNSILTELFDYLFTKKPALGLIVSSLPLIGSWYAWRWKKGVEAAIWIAGDGQFETVDSEIVDELIRYCDQEGKQKECLTILRKIREQYGHNGIRVGHIVWITGVIDGQYRYDEKVIPSFIPQKPIKE